jgi:hypothetical protein
MASPDSNTPDHWQTITELTDYIGKEHFEDFRNNQRQDFSMHLVGSAFNHCISGNGYIMKTEPGSLYGRHITGFLQYQPLTGLVVANRKDIDLPPYLTHYSAQSANLSSVCADYAIEARSLTDLIPRVEESTKRSDVFLCALGKALLAHLYTI